MKPATLRRQSTGHVASALLAICSGLSWAAVEPDAGSRASPALSRTTLQGAGITFKGAQAGVTPFISLAQFEGGSLADVAAVSFVIAAQPGAHAKPIKVQYTIAALQARGHAPAGGRLTLPIFGLYAGKTNPVTVMFTFADGSGQTMPLSVPTEPYADPNRVYDRPKILMARDPSNSLGFSYMYLKSNLGSPVIIDTDGVLRWVGGAVEHSASSTFSDGRFVIGADDPAIVYTMELDGTFTQSAVDDQAIVSFNHDISQGREALLAGVSKMVDGVLHFQSTIAEMTHDGHVIREWDFAEIIGDHMTSQGDDASAFVHPGMNWIHLNSQFYDPGDNSLVVSSRQHFVMKIDYDTGAIRWILGDPAKWWYTFPSLRAKAITLPQGDFYPIGQHSITKGFGGTLNLFNNGAPSYGLPPGLPVGEWRKFSVVSAYTIEPDALAGREVWRYAHAKTIESRSCSSAYEAQGGTVLIDYATADGDTHTRLVGLGASGEIAFEYQYPSRNCATGWNTIPIPFERLLID